MSIWLAIVSMFFSSNISFAHSFADLRVACFSRQHLGFKILDQSARAGESSVFLRFVTGDGMRCEGYAGDNSFCCKDRDNRDFGFWYPIGAAVENSSEATCLKFRHHAVPTCYFQW